VAELWTNWAREQRCAPERIARPRSESELAEVVGSAAEAGLGVRVVGSGHSFTDCACTEGVMVDLGAMASVLESDGPSGLVTVAGGITLHELGKQLAARGLAMENQGDIDRQTLAGAISTATHGTGGRYRNISSQVVGMRLVTADGNTVEVGLDDPETLAAARVGIGCLGAIAAVTLQAVPIFTIERIDAPRPLGETLDRLDELVDGADHFELFTFPYSGVALTRTSTRSDRPPEPESPRDLWVRETLIENRLLELACRVGRRFPGAIPSINRRISDSAGRSVKIDRSHNVYATRRDVRFTEMEYAVPREDGAEAVRRVLDLIERRRLPIGFPIEVRVVAADDAFLSTAHGRDTCYVAVHQYHGMEFENFFRAVEEIMDSYAGRPHWGKRHYQRAETLRPRYPEWDRWQAVRARLDPGGAFTNDYSRRVLGPVPRRGTLTS
jgi:L-gulonolactone oxidase